MAPSHYLKGSGQVLANGSTVQTLYLPKHPLPMNLSFACVLSLGAGLYFIGTLDIIEPFCQILKGRHFL